MKMKKVMALALASAMLFSTAATVSAATELTFWTLNGRTEAVDAAVAKFNEANPDIVVTPSYYDTDGIKDACKVAASSDTLPSMWFNWGGSLGQFYVDNGKTQDLTAFAEANGWADFYSAGATGLCTLGGQLAGLPTSYNVLGVYYNKQIFADLGLEVPTTFEEFEALLPTIKEAGIFPMETGGLYGWHTMRWLELIIEHYAGQELHDELQAFTTSWDCEAVTQAFTKYKEWCDAGYFPDGFLTADPNNTIMNMGMGISAMCLEGQWYDGSILQNELDIANYGTFAFPSVDSNRMSAFAEMVQFNKNLTEEELAAAVKFVEFYHSDEIVDEYAMYYNLPLPINGKTAPAEQANVMEMINTSNANGTFTITDQAMPTEVADVLFSCQDAVALGEMAPEEAGPAIQAAIEAYQAK